MIRTIIRLGSTLLALLVGLALANPAQAESKVPHKEVAHGNLTLVINPTPQNPLGIMNFAAQGVATQMGKYTQVGGHRFTAPNGQGIGLVVNGEFTSTAGDGSTISGTYSGTYTVLANNRVRFNVTALWLTGTRQLAGVTGRADVVAHLNAATGVVHYHDAGFWILP
jgi:hypothetical protein